MRCRAVSLGILVSIVLCGCAVSRPVRLASLLETPDARIETKGLTVFGYIDPRGERHDLPGRVRVIAEDSLEFITRKETMFKLEAPAPTVRVAVHRDSVSVLLVERIDPVLTTFTVLGFGSAVFILAVIAAFQDFCPLCAFGS